MASLAHLHWQPNGVMTVAEEALNRLLHGRGLQDFYHQGSVVFKVSYPPFSLVVHQKNTMLFGVFLVQIKAPLFERLGEAGADP